MPILQQETGGIAIPVLFFVSTDGIALTAVLGKVTNAVAIAHPQGLTAWATCHVLLEDAWADLGTSHVFKLVTIKNQSDQKSPKWSD
jgi:hypothetical protein